MCAFQNGLLQQGVHLLLLEHTQLSGLWVSLGLAEVHTVLDLKINNVRIESRVGKECKPYEPQHHGRSFEESLAALQSSQSMPAWSQGPLASAGKDNHTMPGAQIR